MAQLEKQDAAVGPIIAIVNRFIEANAIAVQLQLRKISRATILTAMEQDEAFVSIARLMKTRHSIALALTPEFMERIKARTPGTESPLWIVEYESGLFALVLDNAMLSDLPPENVAIIWVEKSVSTSAKLLLGLYGKPWSDMWQRLRMY